MKRDDPPLVLVVDDDPGLRVLSEAVLTPHYRVALAASGEEALRELYQQRPDVVLLDVTMPGLDGFETCRRIRDLTSAPIIMVTSRDADHEVVRGLDSGANDYVVKPYSPAQLLARIRTALRTHAQVPQHDAPALLSFDDGKLVLDSGRRVAIVRGAEVLLSAIEYKILEVLARHPRQVLTHDQILENVWGAEYRGEPGYVKTYVGLLRKKIEQDPSHPAYLLSRRGLGYSLDVRSTAST